MRALIVVVGASVLRVKCFAFGRRSLPPGRRVRFCSVLYDHYERLSCRVTL